MAFNEILNYPEQKANAEAETDAFPALTVYAEKRGGNVRQSFELTQINLPIGIPITTGQNRNLIETVVFRVRADDTLIHRVGFTWQGVNYVMLRADFSDDRRFMEIEAARGIK